MKSSFKTLLVAAAAFVAFTTTSCTDKQQDNAAAGTEAAGNAVGDAADKAGNAMSNTADSVKADMAREKGDTAVVVDKPADKVIEKVPATQK